MWFLYFFNCWLPCSTGSLASTPCKGYNHIHCIGWLFLVRIPQLPWLVSAAPWRATTPSGNYKPTCLFQNKLLWSECLQLRLCWKKWSRLLRCFWTLLCFSSNQLLWKPLWKPTVSSCIQPTRQAATRGSNFCAITLHCSPLTCCTKDSSLNPQKTTR